MATVDLSGAADLHCHFGPDAHRERSVDALDAARQAAEAGHAAIVLKSHDYPTPAVATIVARALATTLRVFGGICCDREVGGVNPYAVEAALRLGAKVVWLPTLSSQEDADRGVAEQLGLPPVGLRVIDPRTGHLLDETEEVLALVAQHDAILATGHVSWAEHRAVALAFRGRGRLLVTHAREELAGPNLSVGQCVELADLGATIELCALTCVGSLATRPVADVAATISAVGAARCTLASDFGQLANVPPVRGLQQLADALVDLGIAAADVRTMACANPCALLGL